MALYHYRNRTVGLIGPVSSIPLVTPQVAGSIGSERTETDSVLRTRLMPSFSVYVDGVNPPTPQWWSRAQIYVGVSHQNHFPGTMPDLESNSPDLIASALLQPHYARSELAAAAYTVHWDLPAPLDSHAQRKGAGSTPGDPWVNFGYYVYDITGELGSTVHHHQIFAQGLLEVFWGSPQAP